MTKTVEQYDAELLDLNNQRDALAGTINALRAERDLAFAQETVDVRVANMGEAEREAMRRALANETQVAGPTPEAPADQNVEVTGIGSQDQFSGQSFE